MANPGKHSQTVGERGVNGVAEQAAKIQESFEEVGA